MPNLSTELDGWVERGLITAEQAARIRVDVATRSAEGLHAVVGLPAPEAPATPAPHARGASLVTEALGYLGGVVIIAALGLVAGQLWEDISEALQVALAFGVVLVLLAAGAAVPERLGAPGERLRSVLWAASSGLMVGAMALLATGPLNWDGEYVVVFAAGGAAIYAAGLWHLHRHLLQHAAFLVLLTATAAGAAAWLAESVREPGAVSQLEYLVGLAIWGVGLAWMLLAWGGIVRTRRAGLLLGAVVTAVGAVSLTAGEAASLVALVTVLALVAAAVWLRDLPLLGISAMGTLIVLPAVVTVFFPGELSAAIALFGVGVVLVVAAIWTARRSRTEVAAPETARDYREGPPRLAAALAGVVAVGTTAAALLLALL